jgi:hypothetical protein
MDSNGTRFALLDAPADFRTASEACGWDDEAGAFTLARQDEPRLPRLDSATALARWAEATPYVLDDHGLLGRVSADRRTVEVARSWPAAEWRPLLAARAREATAAASADAFTLDPVDAPAGARFADLHLGGSGLLAAPYTDGGAAHGLVAVHLRRRWQLRAALPFRPVRAWVDDDDRVWVAGEEGLALCRGAPLPQAYHPRADRFQPVEVEPDPLRVLWTQPLPPHAGVVGLAADDALLLVLAREPDGGAAPRQAILARPLGGGPEAPFTRHAVPAALPFATDLAALGGGRVLLLAPLEEGAGRAARRDAPVLLLETAAGGPRARLLPERWPRSSEAAVRLVRHRDRRVRHLGDDGVHRLYRLAQARFARAAEATLTAPLDSGEPGTAWHRLYLEARVPPGCRLRLAARASDDPEDGDVPFHDQPDPAWSPLASELPFAAPRVAPERDRSGLFEVLLQRGRDRGEVRDLRGQYLRLRLTLEGDGRHTPAVHALRAWYPRFSWQAHYLPPHFHQQAPPPDPRSAATGPANAADLRERILACCEGLLTPVEDRIAAAEALVVPGAAPAAFLPRLAALLGDAPRPRWPEARVRRWLAALGGLQRRKGSFGALCQGLDAATDGAVRRGEIVPVELFRLRRTMGTALGISLDDARHPLTLGTGQSGNSLVGESLLLSADQARELLALFAPGLAREGAEREAVERLFDAHARRLTVVLHGPARALRAVVEEVLPALVPAAVQWTILEREHPFVLGLSPLLRIDTYLEQEPPPRPVRLDRTVVARGDLLQNPVALDPEQAGRAGEPAGGPA